MKAINGVVNMNALRSFLSDFSNAKKVGDIYLPEVDVYSHVYRYNGFNFASDANGDFKSVDNVVNGEWLFYSDDTIDKSI